MTLALAASSPAFQWVQPSTMTLLILLFSLALGASAATGEANADGALPVSEMIEKVNNGSEQKLVYGDVFPNINKNADPCTASGCKWPKYRDKVKVPFKIASGYSNEERTIIKNAMKSLKRLTCVKFIKKRRRHTNYIEIFNGSGCWSYVGRIGGKQQLSLKRNGCLYKGIVQHELLHALGFHHEQVRSDRDDYITVLFENIRAGLESQFEKLNTNNLGSPYDFNSVMQYSNKAFSKNGQPTLVAKSDPSLVFGYAPEMSANDIARVNSVYCS